MTTYSPTEYVAKICDLNYHDCDMDSEIKIIDGIYFVYGKENIYKVKLSISDGSVIVSVDIEPNKSLKRDLDTIRLLTKENARLRMRLAKGDKERLLEMVDEQVFGIVDLLTPIATRVELLLRSNNELSSLIIKGDGV